MRAEILVDLRAMYPLWCHIIPRLEVTEYSYVQFSNSWKPVQQIVDITLVWQFLTLCTDVNDSNKTTMHVSSNIATHSRNHCCRGKAVIITYSECVNSLSHPACKAHAPCYTVICGLSGCTIFFNISLVWWLYLPAFFFARVSLRYVLFVYLSRYSDTLRTGRSGDRIPGGGDIFRTRPDRPWGTSSLVYNAYRVFPGGKLAGAWRWPPTPF